MTVGPNFSIVCCFKGFKWNKTSVLVIYKNIFKKTPLFVIEELFLDFAHLELTVAICCDLKCWVTLRNFDL